MYMYMRLAACLRIGLILALHGMHLSGRVAFERGSLGPIARCNANAPLDPFAPPPL